MDNRLDELTTIHWHGLDVQADADGGPRQPIDPGEQWNALFDIHQPAATAWYHPRGMMSRTPFTINGKVMDINRIDEQVQLGRLEIWEIENAGPMNITHSFHVHSAAFQVVGFAGEPPPAVIAGRKDTVIVPAGATVEIAVRFDEHLALMASPRRT